jgi:hypothetical protein
MIAFLSIPTDRDRDEQNSQLLEASQALRREIIFLTARRESEYEGLFQTILERRAKL